MMDARLDSPDRNLRYLKSAFLAVEPADSLISLARQAGGGSITPQVQDFVLKHCIGNIVEEGTPSNRTYIRNILKKIIVAAESSSDAVVEGLYEEFGHYLTVHTEEGLLKESGRIYKEISFYSSTYDSCSGSANFVVRLLCSLNMLEGDTGCSLWPSSLFLSEFILSYPKIFSNKFCFEVGSGVGLVGVCLNQVGASKVILTDGDIQTLANMKSNVELNGLRNEAISSKILCRSMNRVECKYLPWEFVSESELQSYEPDIILGADIIYDPVCVPHLIRVLSALLRPQKSNSKEPKASDHGVSFQAEEINKDRSRKEGKGSPSSYIATVIRNLDTFNYFLKLASEANLSVIDITKTINPLNLLPYMLSYDRSSVHLLRVSFLCD
ncbi:uncharacterized protein [Typha angustifolia]|uniref:uncharacterized protein n=1 Tax=Typha angustifolia TaxID=59011 RepID=UPI003C2C1D18